MYNLTEFRNSYLKTCGCLWEYHRDYPNDNITDSKSFNFKSRFTSNTSDDDTVDVEMVIPLKYLRKCYQQIVKLI